LRRMRRQLLNPKSPAEDRGRLRLRRYALCRDTPALRPRVVAAQEGEGIGVDAPIGMPHPPSRYSWTETSPGVGNT
jgi:hypothetical protein